MKKCDIYVDQDLSKKSMCLVNVFLNVNLLGLEFFFVMPSEPTLHIRGEGMLQVHSQARKLRS